MSVEEYAACEKAAAGGYPLRLVPFLVAWAFDGVPDDVAARFLAEAGAGYRIALRVFRPGFVRGERRAFRYV